MDVQRKVVDVWKSPRRGKWLVQLECGDILTMKYPPPKVGEMLHCGGCGYDAQRDKFYETQRTSAERSVEAASRRHDEAASDEGAVGRARDVPD